MAACERNSPGYRSSEEFYFSSVALYIFFKDKDALKWRSFGGISSLDAY